MIILYASLMLGMAAAPQPVGDAPSGPDIAECVVDNDLSDVRWLLKTLPGSAAEAKATKKVLVFYGGCSDNKAAAGALAWRERAEIAEAAAIGLLGRSRPDVVAATAQGGWALTLPRGASPPADYDANSVGMRMLGDCVVRANPQGALALIRADRGSAAETTAIAGLSGNFASCVARGKTFKLKRQDLRLVVAEPLYHALSR
ncbi:MAG: hypothetical protein ACTHJR_07910 [Sphingomonas sp.]|uniref:hypothetical protein n=1 Tax=Sphingomonas sp. TaxID=28214 RepID=UPI003F7EED6E